MWVVRVISHVDLIVSGVDGERQQDFKRSSGKTSGSDWRQEDQPKWELLGVPEDMSGNLPSAEGGFDVFLWNMFFQNVCLSRFIRAQGYRWLQILRPSNPVGQLWTQRTPSENTSRSLWIPRLPTIWDTRWTNGMGCTTASFKKLQWLGEDHLGSISERENLQFS